MLARSGLVGKKTSRPYLGPSEAIFSMDRKNPKNNKILLIFPYFPGVGPLLLSTRGGGIGTKYFFELHRVGMQLRKVMLVFMVCSALERMAHHRIINYFLTPGG